MGRHRRTSSSLSGPSRSPSSRASNHSASKKKRKTHTEKRHDHKDRKRSGSRDRVKKRRRDQHRRRRSVSSSKSRGHSTSRSQSSYRRSRERDRYGRNHSNKEDAGKHKSGKDHRSKIEPELKHMVSVPIKASQVFEPIGPLAQNKPTGGIGFAIPSTSEVTEIKKTTSAPPAGPVFEFDDTFRIGSESHEFRKTEAALNQNNAERDSVFSIPTPKNLQVMEGAYRSDSQTERAESVAGANSIQRGELSKQKLPLIIPPRRFNTTASQHAAPSEDGQQSSQDMAEVTEGVNLKRPAVVFKEDEVQQSDEPEEEPEDEELEEMANVLGFSSFGSTKGKNHTKDAVEGVHKNKNQVQKFRQYMNRKGGCHLPLPSVKD